MVEPLNYPLVRMRSKGYRSWLVGLSVIRSFVLLVAWGLSQCLWHLNLCMASLPRTQ